MLQLLFTILLVFVLVAACVCFCAMGLMQARRTRRLKREATELGLRFSVDDPFDVLRRYAGFALIGCGHSARAGNVAYGRLGAHLVRAFSFRYEVGHGARRVTRHYTVVVVEAEIVAANLLLWNERDSDYAPLEARSPDGRLGRWTYRGNAEMAASLTAVLTDDEDSREDSYEIKADGLMVFAPVGDLTRGYSSSIDRAIEAMAALDSPQVGSRG